MRKIFLGWRLPMEGGTRISATGVDEMCLCRVDLDSGITNPTSLRTSFAREFQTKPKQDLSQKIYTRTAQPARLSGELTIAPSFVVHLVCSLCAGRKSQGRNFTSHRRCGEWAPNYFLKGRRGGGGGSSKLTCAGTALDSKSENVTY